MSIPKPPPSRRKHRQSKKMKAPLHWVCGVKVLVDLASLKADSFSSY
jgi:hypothetical protein